MTTGVSGIYRLSRLQGADRVVASCSSASSTSSASNSAGASSLRLTLAPLSTTTIFLAFQPSPPHASAANQIHSSPSDAGLTPRIVAVISRTQSSDPTPIPAASAGSQTRPSDFDSGSVSGGSKQSITGSLKGTGATSVRRSEPVNRSFSVHGSISIEASVNVEEDPAFSGNTAAMLASELRQLVNLPFFATVCHSLFTAALIDPVSGLILDAQYSSGQLLIDFGSNSVVGNAYHRDILIVNRSEIELVWNTAVVNSRHKDSVWFSLRDLDSVNVFGVDASSQPVPLPALSSRHLRLELRVKAPTVDFDFDFVISNVNQSGNIVTCRAIGSGQMEAVDSSLDVLSGTSVDFGQISDGVWTKKSVTCKNTGGRPLDVHFSATKGFDVVFRLAGVAGDDVDEDVHLEKRLPPRKETTSSDRLSRTFTRDSVRERDRSSSHRPSRRSSPSSSVGGGSSHGNGSPSLSCTFQAELSNHLGALDIDGSGIGLPSRRAPSVGLEPNVPPSRPLSRAVSRSSSYRHQTSVESDEDDGSEHQFFVAGQTLSASPHSSYIERTPHPPDSADKNGPNQIEDLTMRPGTEYRVSVLYRPTLDKANPPEAAGALRRSSFKVFLGSAPSAQTSGPAKSRRTLNCTAESCTSIIAISSGKTIDFGEVTVGAVKSTTISIVNLSALSTKVEIAAISKVLSANRNVIVIPPHETVEEKLEFFPRRINHRYEKQMFVRNLLNRSNGRSFVQAADYVLNVMQIKSSRSGRRT